MASYSTFWLVHSCGRCTRVPNPSIGTASPEPAISESQHPSVVEDGHPTVNVKVPIGVAKWGMKMAQAFSPEMKDANLDWESITAIIQEGERGKIVEVEDEVDHKTVEVWVE